MIKYVVQTEGNSFDIAQLKDFIAECEKLGISDLRKVTVITDIDGTGHCVSVQLEIKGP